MPGIFDFLPTSGPYNPWFAVAGGNAPVDSTGMSPSDPYYMTNLLSRIADQTWQGKFNWTKNGTGGLNSSQDWYQQQQDAAKAAQNGKGTSSSPSSPSSTTPTDPNAAHAPVDSHASSPAAGTQVYFNGATPDSVRAKEVSPNGVTAGSWAPNGAPNLNAPIPNQWPRGSETASTTGDMAGLTAAEAAAACGPVAAVAFARAYGRWPTVAEAVHIGERNGWLDSTNGMHGLSTEKSLVDSLGGLPPTQMHEGADWNQMEQTVQGGRPIIFDTPGHYFYANQYDPQKGFYVGPTGTSLKNGSEWMRPDQLAQVTGWLSAANAP